MCADIARQGELDGTGAVSNVGARKPVRLLRALQQAFPGQTGALRSSLCGPVVGADVEQWETAGVRRQQRMEQAAIWAEKAGRAKPAARATSNEIDVSCFMDTRMRGCLLCYFDELLP